MIPRLPAIALTVIAVGSVMIIGACSDDDAPPANANPNGNNPSGGGNGDGAPGAPVRAAFGLDARPSNKTCLAPARPAGSASVKLERVFEGVALRAPMAMAQPPGDKSRWFVAQRHGKIVSFPVANPPAVPATVADLVTLTGKPVHTDFEGGFLGFAFHPKFAQNGRLYVTFTTNGNVGYGSEVGYLTTTDNGASFTSYTRVLLFDRPRLEHCGGGIAFGKDGFLYLSFGDGTMEANGQSTDGFFAKVLRIDVDSPPTGGRAYAIPPSNPFANGGGEPATFARGFRNPFRISIDRETGDLWLGDVGDSTWEEINRVEKGANHGWPCREGMHARPNAPASCNGMGGFVDPIVEHAHEPTPNSRSVTGGVVYRGSAIPGFQGTYVYSDFIRLEAWALSFDPVTAEPKNVRINEQGPEAGWSFWGEDNDGEIYAVATFQDSIHKLVPSSPPSPATSAFPARLSQTGCMDPADVTKPAAGLIPYTVNAPLWSDGADKERFIALPDGATIAVHDENGGDFEFPVGTVLVKNFSFGGKRVETRLLVRHEDGDWGGYSYEWNDAQTDADLLPSSKAKSIGDRAWAFPSRSDCMRCHTTAAGRTLGLEIGQLNGDHVYPSTGRISNQLATLDHIGVLSGPLSKPVPELVAYPNPVTSNAPIEQRARAYLHGNCSHCHRPDGGAARSKMDLRFSTPFRDTNTCGRPSDIGDNMGFGDASIMIPGNPGRSLISLRMHANGTGRMPPIATQVVDSDGTRVIDEWLQSLKACP